MAIIAIDEISPYLKQVLSLARLNSSTLGFLPRAAFVEAARHRRVLVAIDAQGDFLGYLLYGISAKVMLAYIVHLCVSPEHRGKHIAPQLVQELKAQTNKVFHGLRVRCRRDYEANKIWPSLGFSALAEMPGRGKDPDTILTVWRLDYGHRSLLTLAEDQESSKINISIDANVFYKLNETQNHDNEECQALLADWLTEVVELCITNELFNEIDRHADKAVRTNNRAFANKFRLVRGPEELFEQAEAILRSLFPQPLSTSDRSDIRQLARSVAASVQFFVTLDPRLLKKSDEIFDAAGIRVLRPADLIVEQDSLIREADYQPVRLAGASIAIERARPMEQSLLSECFRAPQKETKQQFGSLLNASLAEPHTIEVKVIKDVDRPMALQAIKRSDQITLEVPIFRMSRALAPGLEATFLRFLIQELMFTTAKEQRSITRITDQHLPPNSAIALRENGFSLSNGEWIKINLRGAMTIATLQSSLALLQGTAPWAKEPIERAMIAIDEAVKLQNSAIFLEAEDALWPLKIKEVNIPTYIVPIRPEWAMHLFDASIGSQHLFGGNPHLVFRGENAYYRSAKPRILQAPGRILWYVSKHIGKYQYTESIKACSNLTEVVVDKPKPLFTKFHRFGVYNWKDLLKVAKNDLQAEIMGFRFAKTELLTRPVHKNDLQKLWREKFGKHFHIQGPLKIPEDLFLDIYSMST